MIPGPQLSTGGVPDMTCVKLRNNPNRSHADRSLGRTSTTQNPSAIQKAGITTASPNHDHLGADPTIVQSDRKPYRVLLEVSSG